MGMTDQPSSETLAPVVREILRGARKRTRPTDRLSVDARSLSDALSKARPDEIVPVIAEVKPTSPTTEKNRDVDPVETARSMVDGGASAISVLTEPEHFGGSIQALEAVREAVSVPVLRKDFIVSESQLDAVAADAVLLIARFCSDLEGMVEAARDRGMTPLVEVHTPIEVEESLEAGAEVIGINNRDLGTLTVDRSTVESVAPTVPEDVILIAESGIETPAHRDRMLAAGVDGLLVGSAIMDGDVETNTERLVRR